MKSEIAQSCPTLCDPVDCSLPGSSVHAILQARILEWVAICKPHAGVMERFHLSPWVCCLFYSGYACVCTSLWCPGSSICFHSNTFKKHWLIQRGFPGDSGGKESACDARDPGSIPGSGKSPGEGNGNPLQYSCLENSMDRGAGRATVHGVAKSWTQLSK